MFLFPFYVSIPQFPCFYSLVRSGCQASTRSDLEVAFARVPAKRGVVAQPLFTRITIEQQLWAGLSSCVVFKDREPMHCQKYVQKAKLLIWDFQPDRKVDRSTMAYARFSFTYKTEKKSEGVYSPKIEEPTYRRKQPSQTIPLTDTDKMNSDIYRTTKKIWEKK